MATSLDNGNLGLLADHGVSAVYHYTPLHYLPFVAREGALLSKPLLRQLGYPEVHFRSTSKRADGVRGFGEYVHLSLMETPPILLAKLGAGFPHCEIAIPVSAIEDTGFHLCRYNVAKGRYVRRPGRRGLPEGPANGRYYPGKQIPTAQTPTECRDLLAANFPGRMIEVLVVDRFDLPNETSITFFHPDDLELGMSVLDRLRRRSWNSSLSDTRHYQPDQHYFEQVRRFVETAMIDHAWRGDGLEFDNV